MIPVGLDPASIQVTVVNTRPEHMAALDKLQRIVFPTLDDSELYTAAKYRRHIELFPEGQFVALAHIPGQAEPVVIGATSTFLTNFDFDHIQHTFLEATAGGWLDNHDPDGEWMYGADVSVHPDYRGLRVGRRLYDARRNMARRLNLRGEIAGGLIPHYEKHQHRLSIAQYILQVYQGRLHDPTLSMQIKNGFVPRGIIYDHISDPRSRNAATLIVRENRQYVPVSLAHEAEAAQAARIPLRPGVARRLLETVRTVVSAHNSQSEGAELEGLLRTETAHYHPAQNDETLFRVGVGYRAEHPNVPRSRQAARPGYPLPRTPRAESQTMPIDDGGTPPVPNTHKPPSTPEVSRPEAVASAASEVAARTARRTARSHAPRRPEMKRTILAGL